VTEHPYLVRAAGPPADHLDWPFYEPQHREVRSWADDWCAAHPEIDHGDVDETCRSLVRSMGQTPLLQLVDQYDPLGYSIRSIALVRERLAYHSGLADFAFAMQGLGFGPMVDRGSVAQKTEWCGRVARGEAIAAFALTEPEAGSDAASLSMDARQVGDEWVLSGEKSYISNGTIADFLTVFARTGGAGHGGLSCFLVPADTPGLYVAERIEVMAPHPLARLRFDEVRLPLDALVGERGEGFAIAMRTLNRFRVTVGAAALGLARRALDEALRFSATRRLGSGTLADNAVTQANLAEMATLVDASALLIARAAWEQDTGAYARQRRTAAMAKLHATEAAQKVIDLGVQLHGGLGVTVGSKVEELYREVRALRIYEGASEVQRQIIARDLLKEQRG
jgi:acyl-CoA dehydrogenase